MKNKLLILFGALTVGTITGLAIVGFLSGRDDAEDETIVTETATTAEIEATTAPTVIDKSESADTNNPSSPPVLFNTTPEERLKFAGKRIRDAEALIKERRYDEAMELLDYQIRAFGKPMNRARAQVLLGRILVGQGFLDEALALFISAVESESLPTREAFDAHLDVLRTYAKLGLFDDVAEWIQKTEAAFLAEGQNFEWFNPLIARINLARSLFNLGLSDFALEQAAKISGSDSDFARQASLIEARALIALNRNDEARTAILKGIGENGGDPHEEVSKLYYEMVKMAMRDGDSALAMEWARKGRAIFEDSNRFDDYMYHMATYLRKEGVAGWEEFTMAIASREDGGRRVDALEQLAASAIRNNQWEDAERYFQALVMIPERTAVKTASDYLRLLEAQQKLGKPTQQVIDSLMAFLETNSEADPAGLHRIGKGLLDAGFNREAVAYFEHLVKTTSGDARERALLLFGDARAALGEYSAAMTTYKEVIDLMAAQGRYEMVAQTMYRMAEKTDGLQTEEGRNRVLADVEKLLPNIDSPHELIRLLDYFGARQQGEIQLILLDHARQAALKQFEAKDVNWSEQVKVIQNLYAFRHHDEALALIEKIQKPQTGQPTPTVAAVQEAKFYDALIDLYRNNNATFTEKANQLLADGRTDRIDRSKFALNFGEELYFKDRTEESTRFFHESVSSAPGSQFAMHSRLYLGATELISGEMNKALQHADAIINGMSPKDKISLNRQVYWGGYMLKGLILASNHDETGKEMMNKAVQHDGDRWLPIIHILERNM